MLLEFRGKSFSAEDSALAQSDWARAVALYLVAGMAADAERLSERFLSVPVVSQESSNA